MKTKKEIICWARQYIQFHQQIAKKDRKIRMDKPNDLISEAMIKHEMTTRVSAMQDLIAWLTDEEEWNFDKHK